MSYNYFDKIYCINLKYRKDRYISANKVFNELNIKNVEFYITDKSPKGGKYGCFESHINVIKKAYNSGYNNILIFEDDIKPSIFYKLDLLNNSINFMKKNEWDIFYLGYFTIDDTNNIFNYKNLNIKYNNVLEYNPCATHAYCLNKKSMLKILNTYNKYIEDIHYDKFLSNNNFKNYIIIPMIFEQYYCSPIDNSIENISEFINRKTQCITCEYLNINSYLSYINYFWNNNNIQILLLLIIIIIYKIYFNYKNIIK